MEARIAQLEEREPGTGERGRTDLIDALVEELAAQARPSAVARGGACRGEFTYKLGHHRRSAVMHSGGGKLHILDESD